MASIPAHLRGPAWMLAAIGFSTCEVTLIHGLGPEWPAPLQLFWRQASALLILLPFMLRNPRAAFTTNRPATMLFRSVCAMTALALSIYSFAHLPIAMANALSFTRPLWIVVLASIILREKVDPWRAGAILIGFAGVLVMVQPSGATSDQLAMGAALGASLLFAISFISIKSMSGDKNNFVIMVYSVLFGVLVTSYPAYILWRTPTMIEFGFLAALGVASLGSLSCFIQALTHSDAIALVPLDYLRLPLTLGVGFLLFSELPNSADIAGGGLIVLGTVLVAIRERKKAQAA